MTDSRKEQVIMFIGDVHAPYYDLLLLKKIHKLYLSLLKKHSNVLVVQVGDLVDQTAWSRFPKDPDAPGATDEWERTMNTLLVLSKYFPEMEILFGNHDVRVMRNAMAVGIPSRLLRTVQDEIPVPGWNFHKEVPLILGPVAAIHGDEFPTGSGNTALAASRIQSHLVFGHSHQAGIQYAVTMRKIIWQMNVGCVIDESSIAFRYAAKNPMRCWKGVGLVHIKPNGEAYPTLIPGNCL